MAHSNKNVFFFTLLKVMTGGANKPAAIVCDIINRVNKWACNTALIVLLALAPVNIAVATTSGLDTSK